MKTDYLVQKIPDVFNKDPSSNIGKFMSVMESAFGDIDDVQLDVKESKQIPYSQGQSLDNIGSNVQQSRLGKPDEIYRLFIRSKIQSNLSGSDVDSLINYIATILGVEIDAVNIVEPNWDLQDSEPCKFTLHVPYYSFADLAIPIGEFLSIIKKIVAIGIRVVVFGYGTFALAGKDHITAVEGWSKETFVAKDRVLDREQSFSGDEIAELINYIFDTENIMVSTYTPIIDFDDEDGKGVAGLSDLNQEIGGTLGELLNVE